MELNIIKTNLERSINDQADEIEKTIKFELSNVRVELQSEQDEKLSHHRV